ncbi:DUF4183 domain-containing protein [Paenibacillus motobuensis]|uniref:DUF4183 domain-containing protein n=1 Tax=Paenibacillus TaxID=44249 RepID=UPI00203EEF23|nr:MULTISPECIES: DUF4183 domain-containing protein [Paenibacillus]MCM3042428.1 DUF4183 domain-containing protein [Paenibacillus lutimineralis]MCM3649532.1 DUF4183 domain-containing protein [Paenibacillus motobuensis]
MSVIKMNLQAQSTVSGGVNVTTATNTVPTIYRYSASIVLGDIIGSTTVVQATSFTNDAGSTVPANELVVPSTNGYFNLYVNGVLQRGGLSTLTAANLTINTALVIGATVVVEVVILDSASTSNSTNGLSVSTSIYY